MKNKIDVLLVDDHAIVRAGYKTYLRLADDVGDIYEADTGEMACQIFSQYHPDVVILDLSMPGFGGYETIKRLISKQANCKILVFSIHDEPIYVAKAIKAGAKGYVTKACMPDVLVSAVYKIYQGDTFIQADLAQKIVSNFYSACGENGKEEIDALSPREFDIFHLMANGHTTKQVAAKLHLAHKTVCNYATAIKDKLNADSIADLTLLAAREGLIKIDKTN